MTLSPTPAFLVLLLAGAATAQTTSYLTIPPSYATKPGNSLDQQPLGMDRVRHAQFIDKAYCSTMPIGSLFKEIRYRREENRLDKTIASYEPMRRDATLIPTWEIRLSNFGGDYSKLNPQYDHANNRVALTTVFAGQLNYALNTPTLPPPTDPTKPAPFDMQFPLNIATLYYAGLGMVVDHYAYETRNRTHIYYVDAVETQPNNGGTVDLISPTTLGCPADFNRVHGTAPNPGAGSLLLHLFGAPAKSPAICFLGGTVPPVNLAFMGMPACSIYSDLAFPLALTTDTVGIATLGIPVPANNAYASAVVYSQWAVKDDRVNPAMGFAMSDGVKITLGPNVGADTLLMSVISGQDAYANSRIGYIQPNRGTVLQFVYQ